ncbi:MAG: YeeE/YedE thiosulfate transporter family protein [Tissierellia bacterium]|nr:YeeE/YedE thiosulfate transporter family protein [Tissierellia bacterium]
MIKAVLLGLFFGFSLYYVGANNYHNILKMLQLRNMTLAKIIFFAIGFAAFLTGIAAVTGLLDIDHFSIKTMHLGVILGGFIFGIGFGAIGRCPGTCPAAMGSGDLKLASITFIGGLCGAFIYSLIYGSLAKTGIFDALNFGKLTLFHINDKFPSILPLSHMGLIFMGAIFMMLAYFMPMEIRKNN